MTVETVIQKLELAGYRFTLAGDTIRFERVFENATPEEELRRLLGLLRANKPEALEFLRKRMEPHPPDCVCPDCLAKPFFRNTGQPAGVSESPVLHEADTGERPAPVGTVNVMGAVARVYPTRPECLEAGYCRWLTLECDWYAIVDGNGLIGRCRERVYGAAREARARWVLGMLDTRHKRFH